MEKVCLLIHPWVETSVGSESAGKRKRSNSKTECDSQGSLDIGACCLCHCSLDYSDKAAFFHKDRHEDYNEDSDEEEYFFRPRDPYLPKDIYDPNNALIYCDVCDRMYHQKCHFVPVLSVPRGQWKCLVCQVESSGKGRVSGSNSFQSATSSAMIFRSPPQHIAKELEIEWEHETREKKALSWKNELTKKLKYQVQGYLGQVRLAETALETLTSTAKNRSHFSEQSQELAQGLVRLYGSRLKLRQGVLNLEDIRLGTSHRWNALLRFCELKAVSNEFITRVLFPFGILPRRIEPRTPEMNLDKCKVQEPYSDKADTSSKASTAQSDDDSGISLDDLRCCTCHRNDATDENDLIMCDGRGCYRAFHMQCVLPTVKLEDIEKEDEDWFCPLCNTVSQLLIHLQTEHMGCEWEQRRLAADEEGVDISCDDSLKSWEAVSEVYPDVEKKHEAACDLRDGNKTEGARNLLIHILGGSGSDTDDDEDNDEHFDLEEFHEKRREDRNQNVSDRSDDDQSSQATLRDMSSVEYEVKATELAALSSESDADSSESSNGPQIRRSRRTRCNNVSSATSSISDPGKLDESNILTKKRGRKPVDYVKLNNALFGDLPDNEIVKIDDHDEFRGKIKLTPPSSASESESSSNEDGNSSDDKSQNTHESAVSSQSGNGAKRRSPKTRERRKK